MSQKRRYQFVAYLKSSDQIVKTRSSVEPMDRDDLLEMIHSCQERYPDDEIMVIEIDQHDDRVRWPGVKKLGIPDYTCAVGNSVAQHVIFQHAAQIDAWVEFYLERSSSNEPDERSTDVEDGTDDGGTSSGPEGAGRKAKRRRRRRSG